MSDLGRKDFSEQAGEKLKPDSTKSTTEKLGENISGGVDKAAAAVQPSGDKSSTQKAGDSVRGGSNDASKEGESIVDTVSKKATDVYNAAVGTTEDAAKKN